MHGATSSIFERPIPSKEGEINAKAMTERSDWEHGPPLKGENL